LGASCWEMRRGDSCLPSSDARRCSRLFFGGAMHAIVGESKTMPSWGQPFPPIFLFWWGIDEGSPLANVVLRRRPTPVETRLYCLALDRPILLCVCFVYGGYLWISRFGVLLCSLLSASGSVLVVKHMPSIKVWYTSTLKKKVWLTLQKSSNIYHLKLVYYETTSSQDGTSKNNLFYECCYVLI
jgi:hypothetical protein